MASISSSFRLSLLASEDANRSINTTKNQILKSNISINKISRVISSNTKEKERLAFKSSILDARRREASGRKEIEDRIEASKVSTNPTSGFRMIGSSSAGPFQRLLGFLGFLTAGWLVENLPTIIFTGKEFISRVFKVGSLISDFIGDTLNIISNFGTLLTSIVTNIATFDFTDQSDRVKNSFLDLNSSMQSVNDELFQAYKLLTTPLTQSSDTGEEAPPLGEEAPNTLYPQPSTSSGGGGSGPQPSTSSGGGGSGSGSRYGTKEQKSALDAISFAEGNTGYSTWAGYQKHGPDDLTGLTIRQIHDLQTSFINSGKVNKTGSAVVGRYQFLTPYNQAKAAGLNPETDKFSPTNQDRMAIHIMNTLGVTAEKLKKEGMSVGVTDRLATQWASFPYSPKGDRSYYGQGFKYRKQIQAAYKKSLGTTETQPQTPKPTEPPRPVSTGTMNLIPQTGSGGFIQGGSGSGGESTYATHFHLDAKTANPSAAQLANIREVAFQAVKAMFARGSWIYFGNIKRNVNKNVSDSELKSLIASEQQAHGARSSMGVDIQEHNPKTKQTFPSQPGSATKFPFAVGSVYYRGGYGREAEIIGSQGITVSHGAAGSSGSDLSGKPVKAKLYPTVKPNVEQVITPERKGQTIVVDIPESSPPPQTTVASYSTEGKKPTGQVDNTYLLNRFIKQKLLLELAYL